MKRYRNTRFSRPGERNTVPHYDIDTSPVGTIYYLSAVKRQVPGGYNPRVFWVHTTKGWRSEGDRHSR